MPGDIAGLYLEVMNFAISGVLFKEQDKVAKPIYYISRTVLSVESRYPPVERLGLALVYAS